MKTEYKAEELLMLSGIQHFFFCRRQWALIHVENQWQENERTIEGKWMHNHADNPFRREIRDSVIITRAMPVASYSLGLYGVCDIVEFTPSSDGVNLRGAEGKYLPIPIEYKRGKEKLDKCDEIQLCAQAMCLEEMLVVQIPSGHLFYGATRRRVEVDFNEPLRKLVEVTAAEMHDYFIKGYTPRVRPKKSCQSCSLKDICLPELQGKVPAASKYIQQQIERV